MSVERGRAAEDLAAAYLEQRGLAIVDRNWRNRWCELDMVARGSHGIHFVEVKYRRRADWGTGFEHITRDKIQRLRRAAVAWNQAHRYVGGYQIDIISMVGELEAPAIEYLPNAIND
ncbi:MAG TPA: YraN family protein [Candidatus Saccharimonadia bacterium]|nr:YraN family protein [Candidatus Saccharimonadia bacterium]